MFRMIPMDESSSNYADAVLCAICAKLANLDGKISISLLVGGSWLTGTAIDPRHWFEQLATQLDNALIDKRIGQEFRAVGQFVKPSDSEIDAGFADPRDEDNPPHFLHLANARLLVPNEGFVPLNGALARVKIIDVTAWTLTVIQ